MTPILNAQHSPIGFLLISKDISEELRLIEELKETQFYTRSLIESNVDALVATDVSGIITDANIQMEKLTGCSYKELVGEPFKKYFTNPKHAGDDIHLVLDQGSVVDYELTAHSKSGYETIVSYSASRFYDQAGKLQGVFAAARDITNRKRNENILREKEEELKIALKASQTGTWTWDCVNDKITVDDIMPIIFGLHSKENFPQKYADLSALIHRKDRKRVDTDVQKTLKESAKFDTDFRIVWPDGNERVIVARGSMFTGEDNVPFKITGVCVDVTEKEKARIHLEKVTKELKANNRKLEKSNESLQEFAHVASHDLQEPLRMISSYVQLLRKRYKGKLDKDADEYIQFAVDGASRMKLLINDLLTFARVESQGQSLQETNLQNVLKWTLDNLHDLIKETKAQITFDRLPKVSGDESQLGQLLQNLLQNAIRYHKPTQPIQIHIGVTEEGKDWKFFMQDNGIGIEPQYHERIFKIFQRLHTFKEYPGTGIGLAVCKRIVERHGGKIWVESNFNQGSMFCFTIPKIPNIS